LRGNLQIVLRRLAPLLIVLPLVGCQSGPPASQDHVGEYRLVLTLEEDAQIKAAQRDWESRDPAQRANIPEPRLSVDNTKITLGEDGKFRYTTTHNGDLQTMLGRYEIRGKEIVMTMESVNGKPESGTQTYPYDPATHTITISGPNGGLKFQK